MTTFTIYATKDSESVESVRTSPTITHAQARMLSKAGWEVRVTDLYGRKYQANEIDENPVVYREALALKYAGSTRSFPCAVSSDKLRYRDWLQNGVRTWRQVL